MGTEVLRPQDCLAHPMRISPAAFYSRKTTFSKVNKPVIRSEKPDHRRCYLDQKNRYPARFSPTISKRSASSGDLMDKQTQINRKNNLIVQENIKILRRGESLISIEKKFEAVRVGLPDVYAGSTVTMSPSPRALPVPSFFKKGSGSMCVDDSATKDLRRLLRLD